MDRRSFLRGAALLICAPAIVRASSLMPVKAHGDGVALFSTENVFDAYSNLLDEGTDLSEASIENMIIHIRNANDVFGNRVRLSPPEIIISNQSHWSWNWRYQNFHP